LVYNCGKGGRRTHFTALLFRPERPYTNTRYYISLLLAITPKYVSLFVCANCLPHYIYALCVPHIYPHNAPTLYVTLH